MSTVLVTKENKNLGDIKVINNLMDLDVSSCDCVIYHSSEGTELDLVRCISDLKGKVDKIIYVNNDLEPLPYGLFKGIDADIYDSEDYIEDEDIVNYIVENYKQTGMTIRKPIEDLGLIENGVNAIIDKDSEDVKQLAENELWLDSLTTSIMSLTKEASRSELMSSEMVNLLNSITSFMKDFDNSRHTTEKELQKLKEMVEDYEKSRPSTPFIYSKYTVPVQVKKVLYIKVYGNCKYLLSFLDAYQHYLKMNARCSSKLLLVLPKLKLHVQKYATTVPRIDSDTLNIINLSESDFYVSFEPKKAVLDAFFKQNSNLYIVVDMLYGDTLIDGFNVETFNAVSGMSDLDTYKLNAHRIISSMVGLPLDTESINIPYLVRYREQNEQSKRTAYFDRCEKLFNLLDKVLKIEG